MNIYSSGEVMSGSSVIRVGEISESYNYTVNYPLVYLARGM